MPVTRLHAFWAINGPLDRARLHTQLEQFRAAGLDGVVWHPRFYPGQPAYLSAEYFAQLSDVILHAKSLGLAFWIYDEDGWPSGTVGGQLLARHPELRQKWARLFRERPERVLTEFEHDGAQWYLGERDGLGVDYLNPQLAPCFIDLTHERYRSGLAPEAWEHVEAIFCDEPEFGLGHACDSLPPDGAIPWTDGLNALFQKEHGEALLPLIGDLFFTAPRSAEVRVRFWELLRDRFCESFLKPLNAWCASHGKRFTAHIKGEEHPLFQVPMIGSGSAVYRQLALPGIDALERLPGNDFYPRQLVSSARQFGDGRCMAEAIGGAGWGATPEDLERYLLWLGGHGVTDFVMHLSQYRLDSVAIRDWPPSQPLHVNWSEAYRAVLGKVRVQLVAKPAAEADVLVVSPHRGFMAAYEPRELLQTNIHNAATYPDSIAGRINRAFMARIAGLQQSGRTWHVTDEATMEAHASREGDLVRLGHCFYREVLVADGARITGSWTGKWPEPGALPTPGKAGRHALPAREIAVQWNMAPVRCNSLLIEPIAVTPGEWTAELTAGSWDGSDLSLRFADDVEAVSVNGTKLHLQAEPTGLVARLPKVLLGPTNTIRFRLRLPVTGPYLWLEGCFRVLSNRPFVAGSNGTITTTGPFRLAAADRTVPPEFVAAGFPFLREAVPLTATVDLPTAATDLRLVGVKASAVCVAIDGADAGWSWGPTWEVTAAIAAGRHTISLSLVPSTYNCYGPHHYYCGDAPVISPDQFTGKKNFADPATAPENTLVPEWHFVPLRAPGAVAFIP